jgi:hypothetical protein
MIPIKRGPSQTVRRLPVEQVLAVSTTAGHPRF